MYRLPAVLILFLLSLFAAHLPASAACTPTGLPPGMSAELSADAQDLAVCIIGRDGRAPACRGQYDEDLYADRWLELKRDGKPLARTRVHEGAIRVSREKLQNIPFYRIESFVKKGKTRSRTLTFVSPDGTHIPVLDTDGPGITKEFTKGGLTHILWKNANGTAYEAIVGPNSLKTTDAEGDCVYDWKNLTTVKAVYLGMGTEYEGNANVHRFRLEDGSKLELLAFCWTWLDDYRGKTLIISHGDLTYDAGGEEGYGPYLLDAMPAF